MEPRRVVLDVSFSWHPKTLEVGPYGRDMFVASLCYAAFHLSDGFIPRDAVKTLAPGCPRPGRTARKLVDAGLWHEAMDGYLVHDFADYQLTRADLEEARRAIEEEERQADERRAKDRERQRRSRASRSGHGPVTRDRSVTPRAREDGELGVQVFSRTAVSVREDARARDASERLSLNKRPSEQDERERDPDVTNGDAAPASDPPHVPSEGVSAVLSTLRDGDEGTLRVLEAFRRRGLPPAAFYAALEALDKARPVRSEAAYVVGALRTMEREGTYSGRGTSE